MLRSGLMKTSNFKNLPNRVLRVKGEAEDGWDGDIVQKVLLTYHMASIQGMRD